MESYEGCIVGLVEFRLGGAERGSGSYCVIYSSGF